jgi:hypothetical protein
VPFGALDLVAVVMTAQKAQADVLLLRLHYALPGWDAAAERRDAQDEFHSAAQARAWADFDASMRTTALLPTAWAARLVGAGRAAQSGWRQRPNRYASALSGWRFAPHTPFCFSSPRRPGRPRCLVFNSLPLSLISNSKAMLFWVGCQCPPRLHVYEKG